MQPLARHSISFPSGKFELSFIFSLTPEIYARRVLVTHNQKCMQAAIRSKKGNGDRGFTLIEILIVIGMLAILTTVVLVAVNPLRQFAQARNSQRQANVSTILNAVSNRIADNRGRFLDGDGCTVTLPDTQQLMAGMGSEVHSGGSDSLNIRPCLVPAYISEMPVDPHTGSQTCDSIACATPGEAYNSGYYISQDPETMRVKVCAPAAAEPSLGTEEFCLSR